MGSRPLSTKNTGTKAQVALQNTKRAFMHKYNKTGVNRCKYNKVTTIQCTQTHTILQSTLTHFQLTSSHTCYKYSTWEENEEEDYNQHNGAHSNTSNGLRWYARLSLETERGISCQSTNLSCQSFQLAWVKTAFCDSNNTLNIRYCEGYALLYCGHSLFTYAAEN